MGGGAAFHDVIAFANASGAALIDLGILCHAVAIGCEC